MKYAVSLLLLLAVILMIIGIHHKEKREDRWMIHQSAMNSLKNYLGKSATIGLPQDSNHVFDTYEVRYWLAPSIAIIDKKDLDTQLLINVLDERPIARISIDGNMDTLWHFGNKSVQYILITK